MQEVYGTVTSTGINLDKYVTKTWLEDHKGELVEVKPISRKRSGSQNRLYWAYLRICANTSGDDPQELHKLFAIKFIGVEQKKVLGYTTSRIKSTTRLNKYEFGEYLDKIESLMIDMFNCPIPEDWKIKMIENHTQEL